MYGVSSATVGCSADHVHVLAHMLPNGQNRLCLVYERYLRDLLPNSGLPDWWFLWGHGGFDEESEDSLDDRANAVKRPSGEEKVIYLESHALS